MARMSQNFLPFYAFAKVTSQNSLFTAVGNSNVYCSLTAKERLQVSYFLALIKISDNLVSPTKTAVVGRAPSLTEAR